MGAIEVAEYPIQFQISASLVDRHGWSSCPDRIDFRTPPIPSLALSMALDHVYDPVICNP